MYSKIIKRREKTHILFNKERNDNMKTRNVEKLIEPKTESGKEFVKALTPENTPSPEIANRSITILDFYDELFNKGYTPELKEMSDVFFKYIVLTHCGYPLEQEKVFEELEGKMDEIKSRSGQGCKVVVQTNTACGCR